MNMMAMAMAMMMMMVMIPSGDDDENENDVYGDSDDDVILRRGPIDIRTSQHHLEVR